MCPSQLISFQGGHNVEPVAPSRIAMKLLFYLRLLVVVTTAFWVTGWSISNLYLPIEEAIQKDGDTFSGISSDSRLNPLPNGYFELNAVDLIFRDGFDCPGSESTPWDNWDQVHPPNPILDQVIHFFAEPIQTGESWTNNGVNNSFTNSRIGDTSQNNLNSSMMLTFDTSALFSLGYERLKIIEAMLWMNQETTFGLVYTSPMLEVKVEHTRYPSLSGAWASEPILLTIGNPTLTSDGATGLHSVVTTRAAKYEHATCQNTVQFRLRFYPENENQNGVADQAIFTRFTDNESIDPKLTVIYRIE